MKRGIKLVRYLVAGIFLIQNTAMATITTVTASDFDVVRSLYTAEISQPHNTLLVLDIDNTLLTMTQALGGPGWLEWQAELLKKENPEEKIQAARWNELLKLQNLFFQIIKMEKTDEYVLPFIKAAAARGTDILALTARSNKFLGITLDQLEDNGFVDKNSQLLFKTNGLKLKNVNTSVGGFECKQLFLPALYYEGILFTDFQDKGNALDCALLSATVKYNTVLFVDDKQANIDAVNRVFENRQDVHVITVLYTHEHARELAFLENRNQEQESTVQELGNIRDAIHKNIEKPLI